MSHSDARLLCVEIIAPTLLQNISNREQEVLRLTAAGLNPAYVADKLNISAATVSQHLKNIRVKLNVRNTTHAVAYAITNGIIKL